MSDLNKLKEDLGDKLLKSMESYVSDFDNSAFLPIIKVSK